MLRAKAQGDHRAWHQLSLAWDHLEALPHIGGRQVIKGRSVPDLLISKLQELLPQPLQRNLAIPDIHHGEALGSPIAREVVDISHRADGT